MELVKVTPQGLYCKAGDFYIDPWRPVENAVLTHAHADHSRAGSKHYFCTYQTEAILRHRIGPDHDYHSKNYNEKFRLGDTSISFHSAGHILGSAQVRIEHKNQVWVVSGDYKRNADLSCDPFEVVECDVFISEATFALPIYRWEESAVTAKKIFDWWQADQTRPSLLFCYSLGKAQRILAELARFTDKPVYLHGAAERITEIYREQGKFLLSTKPVVGEEKSYTFEGDLILAPTAAHRSQWMKRFKDPQTAFASGWMQVRGARRRHGYEKGFVLSDHADWHDLVQTIEETKAKTIYLTHGKTDVLQRFLEEKGYTIKLFNTQYEDTEG